MPNEDYMTTAQVAKFLRVSISTAGRLARSGDLKPVVKVPGQTGAYLFDPLDVAQYRSGQESEAA